MKRVRAILPCLLGLLPLLSAALPLAPGGAARAQGVRAADERPGPGAPVDPDLPAGSGADKGTFLRLRSEHIARLRGYLPNRRFDPAARGRAIRQTERRERRLFRAFLKNRLLAHITPDEWTPIGPAPIPEGQTEGRRDPVSGRTTAIAVHPTNPDIVYAGTAAGGVYRSLDGGASWKSIFDDAESLAVGAIAIAPSRPSTIYVGTGEIERFFGVGVYRIDNADGDSPTLVGPINPNTDQGDGRRVPAFQQVSVSEILVHPTDPATVLVSTARGFGGVVTGNVSLPDRRPVHGVYRSTNATASPGAASFTKLTVSPTLGNPRGNTEVTDMVMEPGNPNHVVCWVKGESARGGGGVYRSTDALSASPTFGQKHVADTEFARGELAINKSGGVVTVLAATGESTSGACAARERGRLRRSRDGGETWPESLRDADGFCAEQCYYDIAVETHQTAADPVIHVGGAGNYDPNGCVFLNKRSVDGGSTFTRNDEGLHADVHAFSVAPSDPNVVYTGNDGGVWKSADGGASWASLNNAGYNATQFVSIGLHPTDREYMAGGTQDNGTELRGADGSWSQIALGDGGYTLIDTNAADTNNVVIYRTAFHAQNLQIYFQRVTTTADAEADNWDYRGAWRDNAGPAPRCRSNNGIDCSDNVLFYAPMALGPGNPNTVYFGTDRLYRSTDMGDRMRVVGSVGAIRSFPQPGVPPVTVPISSISVSPKNDNVRLVGLSNGEVWATANGGHLVNVTPRGVPQDVPVGKVLIDPTDEKTAYVTYGGFDIGQGRHVFKTTNLSDRRTRWDAAGGGIPDVPVNAFAVDRLAPQNVYAGTDIGVFRSSNGGAAWVPFNEGLPRIPVFDIAFQEQGQTDAGSARVLRIATHGRGIWEIQLGGGAAGCRTRLTLSTSRAVAPDNEIKFTCDAVAPSPYHIDTSYWRAFDLSAFGVRGRYDVTSVSFGVERAASAAGAGGTQPVTVRLYANNGGAFPSGTLTELASTTVQVADQAGTVLNVPIAAVVPAGTSELVMEVFTPDGRAAGNIFHIGANGAAESGPSYMSAPLCSVNTPKTMEELRHAGKRLVMGVNGSCPAPTPTPTP